MFTKELEERDWRKLTQKALWKCIVVKERQSMKYSLERVVTVRLRDIILGRKIQQHNFYADISDSVLKE